MQVIAAYIYPISIRYAYVRLKLTRLISDQSTLPVICAWIKWWLGACQFNAIR